MDMKVTLGNVIQIVVILGALFISHVKQREQLAAIETKLNPLWQWWNDARGAERSEGKSRR
jgi:hypothetical protein